MDLMLLLFIFTLAAFLGFELIAKVPSQLHTPLMSVTNAISSVIVVGALLSVGVDAGAFSDEGPLWARLFNAVTVDEQNDQGKFKNVDLVDHLGVHF